MQLQKTYDNACVSV